MITEKLLKARKKERDWRRQNRQKKREQEEQEKMRRHEAECARLMSVVLAAFTRPERIEYPVEPVGEDDE